MIAVYVQLLDNSTLLTITGKGIINQMLEKKYRNIKYIVPPMSQGAV